MKQNRFFGKYYKFINKDLFSFAIIISRANEGDMLQVITPEKSYYIDDPKSVEVVDNAITFNIKQKDLILNGKLTLGELHPLKKKAMGPFTYLPMECRHEIYSMHHSLSGNVSLNGKDISFDNGIGYIEGDSGTNFPKKYVWYNSVTKDVTTTFALASIPFLGFIHFTGILCFIKTKDKEYYLSTYNGAKLKKISEEEIIISKGKYSFVLSMKSKDGHLLKAPVKGNMDRYIKENLTIVTSYKLSFKDRVVIEANDPISSLEYMW